MVLATCLAACGGCAPERTLPPGSLDPVVIGLVTSTEGGLRSAGPEWLKAAELAVYEVNAAGGVLPGRLLEFVVVDDETNPDRGDPIARQMIEQDHVVGIVGAAASSITLAIAGVATPAQVPQISCCSTSDNITVLNEGLALDERYVMRTAPPDVLQSRVVSIAANDLACMRLAILHLDDDYGTPFGEAIEASFEATGGTVVLRLPFTGDQASYSTEVTMVSNANPDCIAIVAFEVSAGVILRDWDRLSSAPEVNWIGTDGVRVPGLVDEAGDPNIIRNFYGTAPVTDAPTPEYNAFANAFATVFGTQPIPFASNNYDAAALLALGIARAGTTDGPAVRDAMREVSRPPPDRAPVMAARLSNALEEVRAGNDVDYQGASGNADIDDLGNTVTPYEIWRYDPPGAMACAARTELGNNRGTFCRFRVINAEDIPQ